MGFRKEKDSMGEMTIPQNKLYGASTQRAIENFPISSLRFSRYFLQVFSWVKEACAQANLELGTLDPKLANAILEACAEIESGKRDDHFVVDVFQTGSGTSTNMNFNEVAANLANIKLGSKVGSHHPIHPNDHVNLEQSSNDIFPTVTHVAAACLVKVQLIPNLKKLERTLHKKTKEFESIVKVGRTHLQDATPISLGQEFSGYEEQIRKCIERIEKALPALFELAIGGTAVGTGINTHRDFGKRVTAHLAAKLKLPFIEASNHFEAQATKDGCLEMSGALRSLSVSFTKIANDIRWMACGPRAGFSELFLPEVQPGSSIMPGKVNPVIPESLLQVCAKVVGNDSTIVWGCASGSFELNTMMPVIAFCLLESAEILSNATETFDRLCIQGLRANSLRIAELLERNLMLATPLARVVGYDQAAEIAKKAYQENKTIREVALKVLTISAEKLDEILDPHQMVRPAKKK
ncbi:MAG: class II fumarate hydratase [Proteobacteria bacterium]|nr:class II fumarate hydratase [Pseudomonadota bacterium]